MDPVVQKKCMNTPSSSSPKLELKLFTTSNNYAESKSGITKGATNAFSIIPQNLSSSSITTYSFDNYDNSSNSNLSKVVFPLYSWIHPNNSTKVLSDDYNYPLLNDKKTFFEHVTAKQLSLCAIKTAGQQGVTELLQYFKDLMNVKMENDTLVWEDKLTEEEAEEAVQKWEEREWSKRMNMESIWKKIYQAFFKLQSVTICMRSYEYVLVHYSSSSSIYLIDLLTKDPLAYSRRQAASTMIERCTNDYFSKMFYVCLWSNCITFLSDYTVRQILLVVTYWKNCYDIRAAKDVVEDDVSRLTDDDQSCIKKKEDAIADARTVLYAQTCNILMSRLIGWIFSSMTAAIGSIVYPKFGTLLGGNLGDSIISNLTE